VCQTTLWRRCHDTFVWRRAFFHWTLGHLRNRLAGDESVALIIAACCFASRQQWATQSRYLLTVTNCMLLPLLLRQPKSCRCKPFANNRIWPKPSADIMARLVWRHASEQRAKLSARLRKLGNVVGSLSRCKVSPEFNGKLWFPKYENLPPVCYQTTLDIYLFHSSTSYFSPLVPERVSMLTSVCFIRQRDP